MRKSLPSLSLRTACDLQPLRKLSAIPLWQTLGWHRANPLCKPASAFIAASWNGRARSHIKNPPTMPIFNLFSTSNSISGYSCDAKLLWTRVYTNVESGRKFYNGYVIQKRNFLLNLRAGIKQDLYLKTTELFELLLDAPCSLCFVK